MHLRCTKERQRVQVKRMTGGREEMLVKALREEQHIDVFSPALSFFTQLSAIAIINPHTEEHFKGWAGVNYDVRPHIQRFDYFRYIIGNSLQVNKLRSAYSMSVNEFQQTYMDSDGWKFSLPRL